MATAGQVWAASCHSSTNVGWNCVEYINTSFPRRKLREDSFDERTLAGKSYT
jgi:hypothetical protein